MPSNRYNVWPYLLGIPVMAGVFALEISTNILETVAYLPVVVLMLWWSAQRRQIVIISFLGTAFLLAGYSLSKELGTALFLNRMVAVCVVWAAAIFTMRYKKSQAAEKKQRNQLNALFNNATEGIFIAKSTGEIVMANPWAAKMYGYPREELINANVEILIPEYLKAAHRERMQCYAANPKSTSRASGIDFNGLKKDGTIFPIDVSMNHFIVDDELMLVAFTTDITERKKSIEKIHQLNEQLEIRVVQRTQELTEALRFVEEANKNLNNEIQERKKVEEKLNASQAKYNAMTHNFPAGWIGVLDKDLKYVLVDGEELNEHGWAPGKLLGKKLTEVIKPTTPERTEEFLDKALHGEKVAFEIRNGQKAYKVHAVPLPDADQEINEILVVIRDVTEREKYEEGLRKALEKERELGELKSRFVTMASHEFRTPLTTILSSAFLLESYSGEKFDREKSTHLGRIKRSAKVLTEILNDFLSLGKLDEGKTKPVYSEVEFQTFMEDLIRELEPLQTSHQSIAYRHAGNAVAWTDKHLMRNIVSNLVSNALKYAGPEDKIEVETLQTGQDLTLRVKDHGIGIPEEERKHIFKRFFRARNAANIQGTGLGLNIVKKYVRLLGGKVSFETRLNEGTTFTVVLPEKNIRPVKLQTS